MQQQMAAQQQQVEYQHHIQQRQLRMTPQQSQQQCGTPGSAGSGTSNPGNYFIARPQSPSMGMLSQIPPPPSYVESNNTGIGSGRGTPQQPMSVSGGFMSPQPQQHSASPAYPQHHRASTGSTGSIGGGGAGTPQTPQQVLTPHQLHHSQQSIQRQQSSSFSQLVDYAENDYTSTSYEGKIKY